MASATDNAIGISLSDKVVAAGQSGQPASSAAASKVDRRKSVSTASGSGAPATSSYGSRNSPLPWS